MDQKATIGRGTKTRGRSVWMGRARSGTGKDGSLGPNRVGSAARGDEGEQSVSHAIDRQPRRPRVDEKKSR